MSDNDATPGVPWLPRTSARTAKSPRPRWAERLVARRAELLERERRGSAPTVPESDAPPAWAERLAEAADWDLTSGLSADGLMADLRETAEGGVPEWARDFSVELREAMGMGR